MKITVIIPTYNRPDMLNDLLKQINEEREDYDLTVQVYNDGSDLRYAIPGYDFLDYYRFDENAGKRNYWRRVNTAFRRREKAHYYIMLADDMRICKNFFSEAINQYNDIEHPHKICLNLLKDERKENWTGFKRKDLGDHYLTQWNDLCFIATEKFFNIIPGVYSIDPNRWNENPLYGSGVGAQISFRVLTSKHNMYQVKESLVSHGKHKSVMNEEARKLVHITSQK